jgi:hypothetical protein
MPFHLANGDRVRPFGRFLPERCGRTWIRFLDVLLFDRSRELLFYPIYYVDGPTITGQGEGAIAPRARLASF